MYESAVAEPCVGNSLITGMSSRALLRLRDTSDLGTLGTLGTRGDAGGRGGTRGDAGGHRGRCAAPRRCAQVPGPRLTSFRYTMYTQVSDKDTR